MKKKILLIEDNPDHRLIVNTILDNAGYEVLESSNAKDGLKLATKEKPDLVLMDIRLPYKKKGISVAKVMRKNKDTRDIPIIFLTAYSTWEQSKEIKGIPNCRYLTKSVDSSTLLKHIEQFLKLR